MTRASHRGVRRRLSAVAGVTLILTLTGCGGDDAVPDAGSDEAPSASEAQLSETSSPSGSASESATADPTGDPAPPNDEPFGQGCGKFTTNAGVGPAEFRDEMDIGIFSVIFRDLIGDSFALIHESDLMAASHTTYFLPTNRALEVLNQGQMGDLLFDNQKRAQTMGRHLVAETLAPSALAGEHKTVAGSTLQVTVDGTSVDVGLQGADVVCGNIELEKGVRVYVIDQLLIT